jgi:RNA polymerase sigma-70 factor (ECF subfamily)
MANPKDITPHDPDNELVERARLGDFTAFDELVMRHQARLYNLARRILRHDEDAQEAVQDALLNAVQALPEFRGDAPFAKWLTRIVANQSLKVLRKRKGLVVEAYLEEDEEQLRRPEFIAPWTDSPEHLLQLRETREQLESALATLSESYRTIFVLRDIEGLSVEETAEILGISQANVKVRLMRARLALREELTRRFGRLEDLVPRNPGPHHGS